MSHVQQRVTSDSIEPNYPDENKINLLKDGIEIRIRVGVEILARIQNEQALNLLNEKAKQIRKEP